MVLSNIGAFEERTGCRVDIGRANVYVWPATRRVTLTGEGRCPDVARLEIEALLVKHDQVRDAWLQQTHLFFVPAVFVFVRLKWSSVNMREGEDEIETKTE